VYHHYNNDVHNQRPANQDIAMRMQQFFDNKPLGKRAGLMVKGIPFVARGDQLSPFRYRRA
jgi:hypothetical protein